ncbi:MAG: arylsulfotransferase family protein [Nitrospinota bacterium]
MKSLLHRLQKVKIPLHFFLIFLLFNFIFIVLFAGLVRHVVKGGPLKNTFLGEVAYEIASTTHNTKKIFKGGDFSLHEGKHKDKPLGFSFFSKDSGSLKGYILFPKYFLNENRAKVQLIRIKDQIILYQWNPDVDEINSKSKINRNLINLERDFNKNRYQFQHPILLEEGGLVFHSFSPLVRVDKCSNLVWQVDEYFHHSIEQDHENNIWSPTRKIPGKFSELSEQYEDDEITKVQLSDGKIIFQKSVTEILVENNMRDLVTNAFVGISPIHLNDIQPVLEDTKFWKRGDVFLSLRDLSMVMLYRPSTNKVIWYKLGPWRHQHDVDIINNSTIGIFDNNVSLKQDTSKTRIVYYDFETNEITYPYKKLLEKHKINSKTEGLFSRLGNDDIFINETRHSRLIRGNKAGEIKWQYIWDAQIFWTRFLNNEKFQPIVSKLANSQCK